MGEKKTPRPFIVACERFKYLEALSGAGEEKSVPVENKADFEELVKSIRSIVNEISDDDGWAFMGDVGNKLSIRYPDFDTRNYGFAKLTPLVSSLNAFEIMSRKTSNPHISHKFIKNK